MPNKIDSNLTEMRFAEESTTMGVLPGSPVWNPLEPNSYGDFGGELKLVARSPITKTRQRKKGTIVDQDASGSFNVDFTQRGLFELMQGFMFADWRKKTNMAITSITSTAYQVVSSTGIAVGDLIFVEGFTNAANNGLKRVTAVTGTSITAAGLANEATAGTLVKCGVEATVAADIKVSVSSGVASLTSTTLNFTTMGLIPGEWIRIGGSLAAEQFATAANNGFARVKTIAANAIVLDRQPIGTGMVTDTAAGKTIRLFTGYVIKNENQTANIKQRSYHLERYYVQTTEYEYLKGCIANTMEFSIKPGDKIAVDLGFIASTTEEAVAPKSGTRPAILQGDVYNSANDYAALRLMQEDTAATLATYLTELTVTINNGAELCKSIGVLGAFDVSIGDFMVGGAMTAYYTSAAAVAAVKANKDVSLDFALAKNNAGWYFDLPLLALGDARRTVEKDKPVLMPLTMEAAAHATLDHTLLVCYFPYLP